jgi:chromosome segregation ATPase
MQQVQREARKAVDQLEAHARTDRDWIVAAQAHVERLAGDLARHNLETTSLREALERADAELLRQRASELEHIALLREQLAEAVAAIEDIGAVVKRQATQITKLRADLKKATTPPAPAKAAAKKAAAPKVARAPRSRA